MNSERRLEAEKLLSQTFWQSAFGVWPMVDSFRRVAYIGLKTAPEVVLQENLDYWKSERTKQLLARVAAGRSAEDMASSQMQRTVADARYAVDAASLVLAHSVLDDALYDYCRVTALACPEAWERRLLGRSVTLREAKEQSFETLRQELLEKHLKEKVERSSLPEKADALYEVCRPPSGWRPRWQVHEYDRERLARLDATRHRIVHEPAKAADLGNLQQDLFFLQEVLSHFLDMVQMRCGIKVNAAHVIPESAG